MIRINLVPAEILAKARQRQLAFQAVLIVGVFAVLVAALSFGQWVVLRRLQGDYSAKQSRLKQLAVIVAQVDELSKSSAAVRARLAVIDSLLKGRAFYPIFMSEFARTVPPGVIVSQLTTSVQSSGGLKLSISARAAGNVDIAAWIRALETNSHFSGVELGAVSSTGAGGSDRYSFSLAAAYAVQL